ncbi:MAG: NAD(+)/NADH kinase [Acidobacteria bacterium]|nr:NAD(+)/NADH kinase [Acidobacteriota bacterium]
MKRVGMVLHPLRGQAEDVGRWLARALSSHGIEVQTPSRDAERLGTPVVGGGAEFPEGLDLLFSLGGDGTLLRAAEIAHGADVPLLGVNLGRLGFLAELEREEIAEAIERIVADGFDIEERMVIEGEVVGGAPRRIWALNDVIVAKAVVGRAIKFTVAIGGDRVLGLSADGLIVATPTGSTAYSFSARGTLVSPRLRCLIVTPVSAHDLFDRTLVASGDESVEVTLMSDPDIESLPEPGGASVSADGRPGTDLSPGAAVRLGAGARPLRLAKVSPAPFWRLVREKLRLPEEPRPAPRADVGGEP